MYQNIYGNNFLCSLVKYSVVGRWGLGVKGEEALVGGVMEGQPLK